MSWEWPVCCVPYCRSDVYVNFSVNLKPSSINSASVGE
jgi:hypothetical protein